MNGKFIKSENIRSLPDSMSNLSVRRGLVALPSCQLILHCKVCRDSVDFGFMTRYFLPEIILFDASPQGLGSRVVGGDGDGGDDDSDDDDCGDSDGGDDDGGLHHVCIV